MNLAGLKCPKCNKGYLIAEYSAYDKSRKAYHYCNNCFKFLETPDNSQKETTAEAVTASELENLFTEDEIDEFLQAAFDYRI